MKWFKSLRVRFALWVAGLILAVILIFGTFVYLNLQTGLANSIDDSLRLSASQAIAAVNIENGAINFSDSIPETDAIAELRARGLTIRILSLTGQTFQSFGPYQQFPVDPVILNQASQGNPVFSTFWLPGNAGRIRVYTASILDNGHLLGIVQVIQNLDSLTESLNHLLAGFLISAPLLIILSALSGYVLAGRALAPIDQMNRTAQQISAEDLTSRLTLPAFDDEVGRLTRTFNEMLERLEDAFKRERQFTADASHELRTPLAAMQAIVTVVREEHRSVADYEKALDDLTDELDRLRTLAENLLQLTHGDSAFLQTVEPVDLSSLVEDVAYSMKAILEEKGLELNLKVSPGLVIQGDSDALIRVFANLLMNAVKYTDYGSVTISTLQENHETAQITIEDTGRGISTEHLPHIFERFFRVDPSRSTTGAGLGLAIADEIIKAHHGTIQVESAPGKGSRFIVRLPVSKPVNVGDHRIKNPG